MSVANTAGEKNRKPQLDPTANPSSGHSLAAAPSVSSFCQVIRFMGGTVEETDLFVRLRVMNAQRTFKVPTSRYKKKYVVGTR